MQVNPADIRFTQDSISLYFQKPYDHFSVREAVRKISRNEMTPGHFPLIRVISYGGCLWSVDNRRLWVFRSARCPSIAVKLVKYMHRRLEEVLSNSDLHSMMQVEDFFPRVRDRRQRDRIFMQVEDFFPGVRDRGQIDRIFNRRFPQPVPSLQWSENDWTMPPKPSINHVPENAHLWKIANVGRMTRDVGGNFFWNIFSVARKITAAVARRIASFGRMTKTAVGSFFWNIFSVARNIAAAAARPIASFGRMTKTAVGSFFWNIFSVARKIAAAVARKFAA